MVEEQQKRERPPYTAAADLDIFFKRITNIADPGQIDTAWVRNHKLAKVQPQGIVAALKWLGIINESGKSTGLWNKIRVPSSRQAELAKLIKSAYKDVFDRFDDIAKATREDLNGTFIDVYESGHTQRPIGCFVALCKHAGITTNADMRKRMEAAKAPEPNDGQAARRKKPTTPASTPKPKGAFDVAIPITLSMEIPAGWTEDQIRERIELVRRAVGSETTDAS